MRALYLTIGKLSWSYGKNSAAKPCRLSDGRQCPGFGLFVFHDIGTGTEQVGLKRDFNFNQINQKEVSKEMLANNDEDVKEIQNDEQEDNQKDNIFSIEEIKIEEMAIDGICGVY